MREEPDQYLPSSFEYAHGREGRKSAGNTLARKEIFWEGNGSKMGILHRVEVKEEKKSEGAHWESRGKVRSEKGRRKEDGRERHFPARENSDFWRKIAKEKAQEREGRGREKGGEEMHCGYWSYPWFRSCLVLPAISSLWRII